MSSPCLLPGAVTSKRGAAERGCLKGDERGQSRGLDAGLLGAPRILEVEPGSIDESDTGGGCQPLGLCRVHCVPDFHLSCSGHVIHLSTGRSLHSH